jgi:hypothetical protein
VETRLDGAVGECNVTAVARTPASRERNGVCHSPRLGNLRCVSTHSQSGRPDRCPRAPDAWPSVSVLVVDARESRTIAASRWRSPYPRFRRPPPPAQTAYVFDDPQRVSAPVSFDADRNVSARRRDRPDDGVGQRMSGEDPHDADNPVLHHQRVARERHDSFSPRPVLIARLRIGDDRVVTCGVRSRAMRPILNGPRGMSPCGPFTCVWRPALACSSSTPSRSSRIQILAQAASRWATNASAHCWSAGERVGIGQRQANGRVQGRQLRPLAAFVLGAFALRDVLLHGDGVAGRKAARTPTCPRPPGDQSRSRCHRRNTAQSQSRWLP